MKNLDKKLAYYVYGIEAIEEYNSNLLCMRYGNGKFPYVFHKEKAYEFLTAICGDLYSKERFEECIENHSVAEVLEGALKGRGFVLVTDCKDENEYNNPGPNGVIGITSLNFDGEMRVKTTDDLFSDNVTFEERYNDEEIEKYNDEEIEK